MPRMLHCRLMDNTASHRARRREYRQLLHQVTGRFIDPATFQRNAIPFVLGGLTTTALGLWSPAVLLATLGLTLAMLVGWLIRLAQVERTKLR